MTIFSMMRRASQAIRRLQTQAPTEPWSQPMRRALPTLSVLCLAVVLPVAVPAAIPVARAAGPSHPPAAAPQSFHDLPGVKPQSGDLFGNGYRCETELRQVRQRHGVRFFGDGVPVRVYRCTRDGVVYESTEPPNPSGGWYPGVNPRIIDR
ncbi:hypothetical protein [Ciceribacter selenitireducens]|uniref:hypothetical protein n=1 Tax=Ciceribacter selenitireducens TaxID=448181 RepID=UPI000E1FC077|nr:hypothetical protein [Ciceribacter selenitireducens]